jgi:hypothetical protein
MHVAMYVCTYVCMYVCVYVQMSCPWSLKAQPRDKPSPPVPTPHTVPTGPSSFGTSTSFGPCRRCSRRAARPSSMTRTGAPTTPRSWPRRPVMATCVCVDVWTPPLWPHVGTLCEAEAIWLRGGAHTCRCVCCGPWSNDLVACQVLIWDLAKSTMDPVVIETFQKNKDLLLEVRMWWCTSCRCTESQPCSEVPGVISRCPEI